MLKLTVVVFPALSTTTKVWLPSVSILFPKVNSSLSKNTVPLVTSGITPGL
ncbi:hypothetical protein D3C76_536690 [compost metagenome]